MKKHRTIILSTLILVVLILPMSCKQNTKPTNPDSKTWESNFEDIIPKPMVKSIKESNLVAPIPIEIKDNSGEPIKGAKVELLNQYDVLFQKETDKNGIVIIEITNKLLAANPIIRISKDGLLAKDIQYDVGGKTMTFSSSKDPRVVINFDEIKYIVKEDLKIYYTDDDSTSALNCLDDFLEGISFCKEFLGNQTINKIYPVVTNSSNTTTIGEAEGYTALPVNINNWKDKYWFFIHETIEHNLINTNNIYNKNPYLRWIGDGLAEYASAKYLKSINRESFYGMIDNRLNTLKKSGNDKFELNKWAAQASGNIEGYSYSMAFWINLENNYGEKAIKDFLNKFDNSKQYNEDYVLELLKSVTNETDSIKLTMEKDRAINIIKDFRNEIE